MNWGEHQGDPYLIGPGRGGVDSQVTPRQGTLMGMDFSYLDPDSGPLKTLNSGLGLFLTVVGVLTVVFGPVLRRLTLSHSLSRLDALEKTARAYVIAYQNDGGPLPKAEAKYRTLRWIQHHFEKVTEPLESALDSAMSPLQLGDAQLAVLAEKYRTTASNAYVMATIGLGSLGIFSLLSSLIPAAIVAFCPTWPPVIAPLLFLVTFYLLLRWRMKSLKKQAAQMTNQQVQRFMAAAYPGWNATLLGGQFPAETAVQTTKESDPQDRNQLEETPPPSAPVAQPKGFFGNALTLIIGLLLRRKLR